MMFENARLALARLLTTGMKGGRGSTVSEFLVGRPTFPETGYRTHATHGFKRNATVYAGLMKKARGLGAAPVLWYRPGTNETVETQGTALLRRPNHLMSGRQLLVFTSLYLDLGGNAYWEKVRNGAGRVTELWPLRPDRVQVIPDRKDLIAAYQYDIGDERFIIPARDIVRFTTEDPLDDFYGFPTLGSALRALALDNEAVDFGKAVFENSALPGGIIKLSKEKDDIALARIKSQFVGKVRGDKRGEPVVFNPGMDFTPVSFNLEEVAFESVRAMSITEILGVLGVPPILVGAKVGLDRSTFANYAEARRSFHEDTIEPLQELVAAVLTGDADFTVKGLEAYFDNTNIAALSDVRRERRTEARENWMAGLMRLDETRAELDLPPVGGEEGESFRTASNPFEDLLSGGPGAKKDPAAGDGEDPEDLPAPPGKEEDAKGAAGPADPERRAALALALSMTAALLRRKGVPRVTSPGKTAESTQRSGAFPHPLPEAKGDPLSLLDDNLDSLDFAELWEGRLRRKAQEVFRAQAKAVRELLPRLENTAGEAARAGGGERKAEGAVSAAQVQEVLGALNQLTAEWTPAAAKSFEPLMVRLLGGSGVIAARRLEVPFDIDAEEVRKAIEGYTYRFAEKVSKSSANAVREVLLSGQDEGLTVKGVAKELEATFKSWDGDRAELVARTETMRGGNGGVKLAYQSAGVTKMSWLTASDPCPVCEALNGKTVGITEPFLPEGGSFEYPEGETTKTYHATYGEVETPPLHPRCRCTIVAED